MLEKILALDARWTSALLVKRQGSLWRALLIFFAHSCDSWFWLVGLILVWFLGSPAWRTRAAFMAIGLTLLAVLVLLLKFTIRRPRPDGQWGRIYRQTDPHSFPSGHAARAAALAVMAIGIGPTWFAVLLCFWAPLVGLSRIALGVHYVSDVVIGWLIGLIMGALALLLYPLMVSLFPFLF